MLKISDILKYRGLFANDIRKRFTDKQIKISGNPCEDIVISELDDIEDLDIIDAGDFLFKLIKSNKHIWVERLKFFGIEGMLDTNISNDLTIELDKFFIIRISKKDLILIKK